MSSIFFRNFLYFFEKYAEILTNYRKKISRKLEKNYEIPKKEIGERLRKLLGNFTLNFLLRLYKISVEFQNKFVVHLKVKILEL